MFRIIAIAFTLFLLCENMLAAKWIFTKENNGVKLYQDVESMKIHRKSQSIEMKIRAEVTDNSEDIESKLLINCSSKRIYRKLIDGSTLAYNFTDDQSAICTEHFGPDYEEYTIIDSKTLFKI